LQQGAIRYWTIRIVGGAVALACLLLISGFVYEKVGEVRDARKYPAPGRMIDVDGRKLHLLCKGEGSPTVVIVPGTSSPSFLYFGVQDGVAEFTHVCTYDRPGYGWSGPSASSLSLLQHATELHTLLTNAGIAPPYVMVGHSYGGALIRVFARDYPAQIVGMVLVDSVEEGFLLSPEQVRFAQENIRDARTMELEARFGLIRFQLRHYPIAAAAETPELYRARADEIGSLIAVNGVLSTPGSLGKLGNLPVVVIRHGIKFPTNPPGTSPGQIELKWIEAQKRLAALSTNSELVVANRSGHEVEIDQPGIVVDEINLVVAAIRQHIRLSQSNGTLD
jgi:pimeloyl-ACP methyl ester carboxylesterase